MAASMVGGRARGLLTLRTWTANVRCASETYYVLSPEVPQDTAESNPVLDVTGIPDMTKVNLERCLRGCAKQAINFEIKLGQAVDKLKDPTCERTFENVFNPIEEAILPLNFAWNTTLAWQNLIGPRRLSQNMYKIALQVSKVKQERWNSELLYHAVKEVGQDSGNLNEAQQRLVDMYLLEGRLNGLELQGRTKRHYVDTLKHLAQQQSHFKQHVYYGTGLFKHHIEDFSLIQSLPRSLAVALSGNKMDPSEGPWTVTLNPSIYHPFMEYCPDRMVRWNTWKAHSAVASVEFAGSHQCNHKLIEEIRLYRRDLAELLGYENYAEPCMENKMAGTIENVVNMIETLKNSFRNIADEEIKELQDFAGDHGFWDKIQMWDIDFWKRRHRQFVFQIDENATAEYFTLDNVLTQLFTLCTQLFGVHFKEDSSDVETWHERVRFYKVYNEHGTNISGFFLDPFSRSLDISSSIWMQSGREKSHLFDVNPFSYLVMNLTPPSTKDGHVFMKFTEVLDLFQEFGSGLQQMLTQVPYAELSGQRNVEQDALQVCGKFMKMWLSIPSVVHNISSHYESREKLSADTVENLIQAEKHMSSYTMMRELYLSAYDMEMYISKVHWYEAMEKLWEEFMPLPRDRKEYHPCNFSEIFCGNKIASYYSPLWSEMIAADLFAAFEEVGFDNPGKLALMGSRFRDTYLSLGGSISGSEMFRRFRGRDPSLDALQIHYGVK